MDDGQEPQQLSELEQNALNRKRRLRQFRSQLQDEEAPRPNDGEEDESVGMFVTFRSYKPIDIKVPKEIEVKKEEEEHKQMFLIEEKIQSQLEDALDSTVKETVDVTTLAPRKIDWDLKRAIQDKMAILERRTQKAYAQLISKEVLGFKNIATNLGERLESGNTDLLASAVNSAARVDEYQDEEE